MSTTARVLLQSVFVPALLPVLFLDSGTMAFAGENPTGKAGSIGKMAPSATATTTAALNNEVRKELDSIPVKTSWKHIVIHHTGTSQGTPGGIDQYHREERHMENGMAYHFLIGNGRGMNDGEIFIGQRWKQQIHGGHLASEELNRSSIGICLVGNFEVSPPTERQMESLRALIAKLRELTRLPPSSVTTHRDIHPQHTSCPGRLFKM